MQIYYWGSSGRLRGSPFFLGPVLDPYASLNITRRLQSHANTIWKILNNRKIWMQNFKVIFGILPLDKSRKHRQMWNGSEEQIETYLKKLFDNFQIGSSSNFEFLLYFWLLKIFSVTRYCAKLTGILENYRSGTLLSKIQ